MVKKLKQMADKKAAAPNGLFDSALANSVKESAQQIWLAGMGAFAKAQEEGGKVFEALVKEGVSLQRKTQSVAEEKLGEVTSRMSNMAGDVGAKAGQQWDKLESIFEERVAKSLGKLGVPSAKDVAALSARVDALSAQVAKLSKGAPSAKKAAAAPKAAPKKAASGANGATRPAPKRAASRSAKSGSSASAA
jgi:poly(hydroxyalkanoate) granule-associated protein